jgi:dolichol-phosphate mannosyltransferase
MNDSSLSIVIPIYNEQESISEVIHDIAETVPTYFDNYEIIAVNDGSTDNTSQILQEISQRVPTLKIVNSEKNKGFGVALFEGLKVASKEFSAYVPGDGQFLISDMRHCLELLEGNDLILGYRGGRSDYTVRRIVMSYGYLTLLTLLFGLRYMDVGWVHIWRTSKLRELKLKPTRGIFVLTEVVVLFERNGWNIAEGPSYYHPRIGGKAKNVKISVVIDTFVQAIRLFFRLSERFPGKH